MIARMKRAKRNVLKRVEIIVTGSLIFLQSITRNLLKNREKERERERGNLESLIIPVVYSCRPFEDPDRTLPRYSSARRAILASYRRFFELPGRRRWYPCAPRSPQIPSNLEDIVPSSPSAPRDRNHCNPCRPRKPRGIYLGDLFSGSHLQCKHKCIIVYRLLLTE